MNRRRSTRTSAHRNPRPAHRVARTRSIAGALARRCGSLPRSSLDRRRRRTARRVRPVVARAAGPFGDPGSRGSLPLCPGGGRCRTSPTPNAAALARGGGRPVWPTDRTRCPMRSAPPLPGTCRHGRPQGQARAPYRCSAPVPRCLVRDALFGVTPPPSPLLRPHRMDEAGTRQTPLRIPNRSPYRGRVTNRKPRSPTMRTWPAMQSRQALACSVLPMARIESAHRGGKPEEHTDPGRRT